MGPGRILDHTGILRGLVALGVLAATVLSFNLIEATASSAGTLSSWIAMDGNIRYVSHGTNSFGFANEGTGATNTCASNSDVNLAGSHGVFNCGSANGPYAPNPPVETAAAKADPSIISTQALSDPSGSQVTPGCAGDATTFANGQKYGGSASYNTPGSGPNTKTDLTNAYFVAHTASSGDKELYFGVERLGNLGDVAADVEFLQAGATLTSGCGGTLGMPREQGDFAIEFNFTNGGSLPQPVLDVWQCPGSPKPAVGTPCNNGSYASQPLPAGSIQVAENVGQTINSVTYPGAINCGGWICGSGSTVDTNEFVEGGIDLTALGIAGDCASTVVAESHTSQSNSSDLKDFIGPGNFSTCPSTTTTTPVLPTDENQQVGDTWSDSATVTGSSGAPTGTVDFYSCSPAQLNGASSCSSAIGTEIPSGGGVTNPVALTPGNGNSSTANSPPITPNAPGTWCFAGYYSGQPGKYSGSSDASNNECFTVNPATPDFTTTITAPNATTIGNTWSDVATVTGNTTGGAPSGSVAFTWCKETTPGTPCTGTAGGGSAGTATVPITNGATSTFGSPGSVTPTSAGTYCFNAAYTATPNGPYASVTQQSDDECFTVGAATPTLVTTVVAPPGAPPDTSVGHSWGDTATVTGNVTGGPPVGSVSFTWCKESSVGTPCTGTSGGGTVGTTSSFTPSGGNASTFTAPGSVTPTKVGTYCFNASFTAQVGGNYASVAQQSDAECFAVTPAGSTTSTQQSFTTSGPGSIIIGAQGSVTDTATVVGNATGGPPTGQVFFFLCWFPTGGDQLCPGNQAIALGGVNLVGSSATAAKATTVPYTNLNGVGTYCFSSTYVPDAQSNYNGSTDNQTGTVDDNECFTVNPATPTMTTTIGAPESTTVGNVWSDSATVTGNSAGGAPLGSVAFTLCKETAPATPCTGGTTVGTVNGPSSSTATASTFNLAAPVTPKDAGTYCFNAAYTAAQGGNYLGVARQSDDECFTVTPAPSSTTTQQSASESGTGTIVIGQSVTDTATVSGNTTGGAPAGTVTFYQCGPTSSPSTCSPGSQVGSDPVTLAASGPAAASATSAAFTPTATGTYCFAAVFTPTSGGNYTASSDNQSGDVDVNECVLVTTPDFRVTKTNLPGNGKPVQPGATIPYTVVIDNIGNGGGSATITDTLASNLTMKVAPSCQVTAPDTCTVTNTTGSTWTFTVTLAPGHSATVTFSAVVSPTTTTDVVNTATITSGKCDDGTAPPVTEDLVPHAAVNNCSSTVTDPVPDFTVTKTDGPGNNTPISIGATVPYTVVVKNVGDGAGTATVTDAVPSSLTVQGKPTCAVTAPDTCTVTNTTGSTWTFAVNLAAGNSATVTFSAIVATGATSPVVNTATISDGPCNTASGCSATVSNPLPPSTLPSTTPSATATPVAATPVSTAPSTLAFTGADLLRMGLAALSLLGVGAALVLLARRRRGDTGSGG